MTYCYECRKMVEDSKIVPVEDHEGQMDICEGCLDRYEDMMMDLLIKEQIEERVFTD